MMPTTGELNQALAELGTDWEADTDDPGTKDEMWTGKWHRRLNGDDCTADVSVEGPAFARAVATLVNAVPSLMATVARYLQMESDNKALGSIGKHTERVIKTLHDLKQNNENRDLDDLHDVVFELSMLVRRIVLVIEVRS